MLIHTKIIDPYRPIEDYVAEAKNELNRRYEGDFIDWSTMDYTTDVQTIDGVDVTVFTLTVESAGSMATTWEAS